MKMKKELISYIANGIAVKFGEAVRTMKFQPEGDFERRQLATGGPENRSDDPYMDTLHAMARVIDLNEDFQSHGGSGYASENDIEHAADDLEGSMKAYVDKHYDGDFSKTTGNGLMVAATATAADPYDLGNGDTFVAMYEEQGRGTAEEANDFVRDSVSRGQKSRTGQEVNEGAEAREARSEPGGGEAEGGGGSPEEWMAQRVMEYAEANDLVGASTTEINDHLEADDFAGERQLSAEFADAGFIEGMTGEDVETAWSERSLPGNYNDFASLSDLWTDPMGGGMQKVEDTEPTGGGEAEGGGWDDTPDYEDPRPSDVPEFESDADPAPARDEGDPTRGDEAEGGDPLLSPVDDRSDEPAPGEEGHDPGTDSGHGRYGPDRDDEGFPLTGDPELDALWKANMESEMEGDQGPETTKQAIEAYEAARDAPEEAKKEEQDDRPYAEDWRVEEAAARIEAEKKGIVDEDYEREMAPLAGQRNEEGDFSQAAQDRKTLEGYDANEDPTPEQAAALERQIERETGGGEADEPTGEEYEKMDAIRQEYQAGRISSEEANEAMAPFVEKYGDEVNKSVLDREDERLDEQDRTNPASGRCPDGSHRDRKSGNCEPFRLTSDMQMYIANGIAMRFGRAARKILRAKK